MRKIKGTMKARRSSAAVVKSSAAKSELYRTLYSQGLHLCSSRKNLELLKKSTMLNQKWNHSPLTRKFRQFLFHSSRCFVFERNRFVTRFLG